MKRKQTLYSLQKKHEIQHIDYISFLFSSIDKVQNREKYEYWNSQCSVAEIHILAPYASTKLKFLNPQPLNHQGDRGTHQVKAK